MTQFLIRTDAAKIPEIGTGHLIRCLTIVKYLIKIDSRKEIFKRLT